MSFTISSRLPWIGDHNNSLYTLDLATHWPRLFILWLVPILGISQPMTPLDSLFASDSLKLSQRIVLKPVQWWQHLSYPNSSMNCQFEKSCSNFMTEAVLSQGVGRGLIIGTDRIVRCNPAARHYHSQIPGAQIQADGRLVEPVKWPQPFKSSKSPTLAVLLSTVPGLGRSYAGHPWDGLFSLLLVGGFAWNTHVSLQAENPVMTGINGSLMLLFWSADIYGAHRTARLAPLVIP